MMAPCLTHNQLQWRITNFRRITACISISKRCDWIWLVVSNSSHPKHPGSANEKSQIQLWNHQPKKRWWKGPSWEVLYMLTWAVFKTAVSLYWLVFWMSFPPLDGNNPQDIGWWSRWIIAPFHRPNGTLTILKGVEHCSIGFNWHQKWPTGSGLAAPWGGLETLTSSVSERRSSRESCHHLSGRLS